MNAVFRRRRGGSAEPQTPAQAPAEPQKPTHDSGPWDADEVYPAGERVDLGGLQLPIGAGFEVQLQVQNDQIVGALVLVEESALQVHAYAAPKHGGVWDEVRADHVREVAAAGGTSQEIEGPFGTEVVAEVPQQQPNGPKTTAKLRYLGIDGPRWFLRAVISGRAAVDPAAAEVLESVIRDIVVVRGDEPMAPKEPIPLRLPAEARQALDQAGEQPEVEDFQPFKRGPEISEIR